MRKIFMFLLMIGLIAGLFISCIPTTPSVGDGEAVIEYTESITDQEGIGTFTVSDGQLSVEVLDADTEETIENIECFLSADGTDAVILLVDPRGEYIPRLTSCQNEYPNKGMLWDGLKLFYMDLKIKFIEGGSHLVYLDEYLPEGLTREILDQQYEHTKTTKFKNLGGILRGSINAWIDFGIGFIETQVVTLVLTPISGVGGALYNIDSDVRTIDEAFESAMISKLTEKYENLGYEPDQYFEIWEAKWPSADFGLFLVLPCGPPKSSIPPTAYIDSIDPNPAQQGETVTFNGHGTDPDGEVWFYRWESDIDGVLSNLKSFNKSDLSVGIHIISFKVFDAAANPSDVVSESLTITSGIPIISELTADPPSVDINQTTTITCTVSDPDDDSLTYAWTKTGGTFIGSTSESTITWRAPSTSDTYTVVCVVSDGEGNDSKSVDILVSNPTVINQAPYIPNNPSPTDNSLGVLVNTDLGWTGGDPDPEDTVTYDVYFEANDSSPDILVSNDQSNTTYNPGILNYNTHYYWKIIAKDNHGKETPGTVWDFITESQINNPPNLPNTPSGPSSGKISISYSFSTSTTDPDGDNIAYKFDWGDGNISNWTSYVSSGNIVNQLHSYSTKGTYYIKVKAKDINGAESLWSNSHKIIIDLEITKPVAPSKLSATTLSQNNVALVWQDNADNETGFKIERKTGTTGIFVQIATIGATAGSGSGVYYEDSGLTPGTTYCYRVRAYNTVDNSSYSDETCTTTDPSAPLPSATTGLATNITFNSVTLNGTVNPNGVETGALFQWGTTATYGNLTDSQFLGSGTSNVNIPPANVLGLSSNTIYHFRIVATNSAGGTTYGEDRVFTTPTSPSLSFTGLTPSQISTSTSPYQATLSASGSNFNNVNRVSFNWSGAVSGSATWYKGDANWNNKVTINSDNSMTLQPGVVETNPTWSGTAYWTVTLRDNTGATVSKSFTVTYTSQNVTLTLYIYENSTSGPPLLGVSVGIVDGGGNSFGQTTNSSGYVTITGTPGTWYFSASKSGYDTNSWSQSITTNCTKYGYIVKSATPVGAIDVFARLDGSAWCGSLSYSLTGASSSNGSTVPAVLSNKPIGSYSIVFNSGGPSNTSLSSITPSSTQTLSEGEIIAFTFNFVTQTP